MLKQHISLIVSPCYRSVSDRFNVGRATALRAVRRVTHAVFRRSEKFIKWPSGDRAVSVIRGFEEASFQELSGPSMVPIFVLMLQRRILWIMLTAKDFIPFSCR